MDKFWAWAGSLRGQTVQTVTGKPFDVVAASRSEGITIVPRSSGIARTVLAAEFERALALGLRGHDLNPRRIRDEGASEYNPAYVAAMLKLFNSVQMADSPDEPDLAGDVHNAEQHCTDAVGPETLTEMTQPPSADSRWQEATRLLGRLKSTPRVGLPDRRGRPTAWAKLACHDAGQPGTRFYSCSFHGDTMNVALALALETQIEVEGYMRPSEDTGRMATLSVVRIISTGGNFAGRFSIGS
jgi:hypothetical protein